MRRAALITSVLLVGFCLVAIAVDGSEATRVTGAVDLSAALAKAPVAYTCPDGDTAELALGAVGNLRLDGGAELSLGTKGEILGAALARGRAALALETGRIHLAVTDGTLTVTGPGEFSLDLAAGEAVTLTAAENGVDVESDTNGLIARAAGEAVLLDRGESAELRPAPEVTGYRLRSSLFELDVTKTPKVATPAGDQGIYGRVKGFRFTRVGYRRRASVRVP